jgi:adenylate cyclase
MQIAERIYSLAREQDDATVMIWAYNCFAATLYFLGDFEGSRQNAMRGILIWRSGNVQSRPEDVDTPVVSCLGYKAFTDWHLGEIASCQATITEAISLSKELNDENALAIALNNAAVLASKERDPAAVDRWASDLIELSTRHNFLNFLALGTIHRGWARSASGDTEEGISWIERGITDLRAIGGVLGMPIYLARKAETLHRADRTTEALEAINEAEVLAERFEQRFFSAEMHRLRGVFLASLGSDEAQIEASLGEAIKTAREQKSVSLTKRAEATYAQYHRQKAATPGARAVRLSI